MAARSPHALALLALGLAFGACVYDWQGTWPLNGDGAGLDQRIPDGDLAGQDLRADAAVKDQSPVDGDAATPPDLPPAEGRAGDDAGKDGRRLWDHGAMPDARPPNVKIVVANGSASVGCPGGYTAVGGGGLCASKPNYLTGAWPEGQTGWHVTCYKGTPQRVWVVCVLSSLISAVADAPSSPVFGFSATHEVCSKKTKRKTPIGGGCVCRAGGLVSSSPVGNSWTCQCEKSAAITPYQICAASPPGYSSASNSKLSACPLIATCSGNVRALGGGCAGGRVREMKPGGKSFSCTAATGDCKSLTAYVFCAGY